jgi:hypothetical protein
MLFMTCAHQPALRCSICDQAIESAANAAVLYPCGIAPGEIRRACLSHKGDCLDQGLAGLESDHGHGCWMELAEYAHRLMSRTAPPPRELPKQATGVARVRRGTPGLGGERRERQQSGKRTTAAGAGKGA